MTNLQLFAEGDGSGADGGDGDGTNKNTGDNGDGKTLSFDDFLAQEGNQAEFDRRLQKAIQTAVANEQKKWKTITDDKLSEAEKLAQMTKEEKAEYRADKLEKELSDMKRQNAITEMEKTARKILAEEDINIPDELLQHLVSEDAEDTKATVSAFTKLFNDAVQNAVKDKLKGGAPKKGTGKTITREQILDVKNPAERQKLISENMELFTK